MDAIPNITVASLAAAKNLDPAFLSREFGLHDDTYHRQPAVMIPVWDADGKLLYHWARLSGGTLRRVPAGGSYTLYGLWRLPPPSTQQSIVLGCEGASDVWTCAHHGVAAIGVPSATAWRSDFVPILADRRFGVWEEPDPAGRKLICAIAADLPSAWVIRGDAKMKDLNALHQLAGNDFRRALRRRLSEAVPIAARVRAITRPEPQPQVRRTGRACHRPPSGDAEFARVLDRARSQSIESVFAELGIELLGRGSERAARCPLHDDGRASMSVNTRKGVWHCHVCEIGGDGIHLVRLVRGVGFRDAVMEVAS